MTMPISASSQRIAASSSAVTASWRNNSSSAELNENSSVNFRQRVFPAAPRSRGGAGGLAAITARIFAGPAGDQAAIRGSAESACYPYAAAVRASASNPSEAISPISRSAGEPRLAPGPSFPAACLLLTALVIRAPAQIVACRHLHRLGGTHFLTHFLSHGIERPRARTRSRDGVSHDAVQRI
jgi:hypothetical protein